MPRIGRTSNRTVSILSTTLSIFLVLFLIGLLEFFLVNARYIAQYAKENIVVRMMFREPATHTDAALVYGQLMSSRFINTAMLISKEDALEIMEEDMGEGFEEIIGINPFPYSIDFTVKEEWANLDSLASISTLFLANPLVRELHYPTVVIRQVEANFRVIGWVLFGVAMGFLAISITLINSTVRLTIYSKRFLVKSMQLVGATRAFIRRPFVMESVFTGLMAAFLACLSLLGILVVMRQVNPDLALVGSIAVLGVVFGSLAVLGFAITAISSYFAVNKFLNLKLEDLY